MIIGANSIRNYRKYSISSLIIGGTFFCEVLMQNPRKVTFLHEIFGVFLFMHIGIFRKNEKNYHIKI